jgi:TrkA domain protein
MVAAIDREGVVMPKITEIPLPGVGVRHEFTSSNGQRVAVVSHRTGRQEISLYGGEDPDACTTVLELDSDDAAALAGVLGAPQVAAAVTAMQRIEGLAIDWLTVTDGSPAAGATIGAGEYRSRTGASVVAVLRLNETYPAPGPDFALVAGDVVVAVGTPEGLGQLRTLLRG